MREKITNEEFLKRCISIHGDRYLYKDDFVSIFQKITIVCHIHGDFEQNTRDHMRGSGCRQCGVIKAHINMIYDTEWFIKKANSIHNNIFDYSKTVYLGATNKVIITCKKHGNFAQKPYSHLQGRGCKKCNSSKGEISVRNWLIQNNIEFKEQKRFKDCRYIKPLAFDFYIKSHNLLIEFDGEQHFHVANKFKNNWNNSGNELELIQLRDSIKTEYCIDNGFDLLRIKYSQNIIKKLNHKFYGTI